MLVIENANIGWAVIQEVIDRNYQNIYYSYRELGYIDEDIHLRKGWDLKRKDDMVPGFSMTMKTRPLVIAKLEEYFREKSVIVRSNRLIDELFVFIYKNSKTEALDGYNDDLVMSFAIGLWVRDTALRLRTEGIELTKKTLSRMQDIDGLYTPQDQQNETWSWEVNKNKESLEWLL